MARPTERSRATGKLSGSASRKVPARVSGAGAGKSFDIPRAALDGTTVALMPVDRDLIITYANDATHDLLDMPLCAAASTCKQRWRLEGVLTCADEAQHYP